MFLFLLFQGRREICNAQKGGNIRGPVDCKLVKYKAPEHVPVGDCSGWRAETWTLNDDCSKKKKHKMHKKKKKNKSKKKDCATKCITTTTPATATATAICPKPTVENICCPYLRCGCICATSDYPGSE
ncbi:unnamed protein product [Rodentolepis nana]|uniref:Secreted protein n=1 Tax=Rodentolepis nana TaxID=102285 RepID=A0A0R3TW81_RODNA|nr:unnamed protein product [Rodentolepis nana]